jgi:hypothetical protein
MEELQCAICAKTFIRDRRTPNQRVCAATSCQSTRKLQWHRQKLATDAAYRQNRADSQQRWRENNRAYWRQYRETHPDYTTKNRQRSRERKRTQAASCPPPTLPAEFAKTDASDSAPAAAPTLKPQPVVQPGRYYLIPLCTPGFAKTDATIVEISMVYTQQGIVPTQEREIPGLQRYDSKV